VVVAAPTVVAAVAAAAAAAVVATAAVVAGAAATDLTKLETRKHRSKGRCFFFGVAANRLKVLTPRVSGNVGYSPRRRLRPRPANKASKAALGKRRSSLATTPICQGMTR
jgi:hypothetical protein